MGKKRALNFVPCFRPTARSIGVDGLLPAHAPLDSSKRAQEQPQPPHSNPKMTDITSKISTNAPLQYGTNFSSLLRGSNLTESVQNLVLVLGTAGEYLKDMRLIVLTIVDTSVCCPKSSTSQSGFRCLWRLSRRMPRWRSLD